MPVHDWSRVGAGIFHDFHCSWIVEIRNALNDGLLPPDHDALAERIGGDLGPEVMNAEYALKQRTLVIRPASEDRIVARIEILSPGNKSSRHALSSFVGKAAAALMRGYHLLLLDLQPPGPRDPQGIHGALWEEIGADPYMAPPDKPLTLAAYSAGPVKTAYVEPIAVGDALPDMPLFLEPESSIPVPLEATYQAAWRGVPRRWRTVLEAPAS